MMGFEFITRTLRTTGIVLLIAFPFGLYYYGLFPTLAFFSGGVWGMINLMFLSALVRSTIRPEGVNTQKAIGLSLIKFPLLYITGYFLLKVTQFDPWVLLAGSSLILAVMVLKVLGRSFLKIDVAAPEKEQVQKAI
ncbi:MAG: hypothetical protein SGI97_07555 [candidate division Zixibacteria bacterium]|nr:hypothetical protein [candidate division Zixibacteria bacterium]